ncbi:hypothetical protein GQ600_7282 [Phytophthora cactorum]|nr:hypothetical protein GQ600_7282 [Phytophthora cactorum]
MQELRDMGFPLHSWQEYQFQEVCLPALRTYQEQYGDLFVPQKFIVPEEEDDDDAELWPRATRAITRTGGGQTPETEQQLKDKKKQSTTSSSAALPPLPKNQVDALNELGFVWRVRDTKWYSSFCQDCGNIRNYRETPTCRWFTIPKHEEDPRSGKYATQARDSREELDELGFSFRLLTRTLWCRHETVAEDSWGLKLGDTVKNIRRGAYDSQVQAAKTVRSVVIPALTTYRRLHGNDASLGQWITRVRSGQVALSSKLRAELDKVGFVWRSNDQRWNEVLLPAFRAYAERTAFSVPPEAPYPRAAWGVNLGGALWHIRNGDSYVNCEDKQRELRTLGILADDAWPKNLCFLALRLCLSVFFLRVAVVKLLIIREPHLVALDSTSIHFSNLQLLVDCSADSERVLLG